MMIHVIQHAVPWFADLTAWGEAGQHGFLWHSSMDWSLLAQFDTDVFRPVREFINNFIESGQVWALIIGLILGYILKSLTSYG